MNLDNGYFRVTTVSPYIIPGDIKGNLKKIREKITEYLGKTDLLVFPELCVTGYTCGDLFLNPDFIKEALDGIQEIQRDLVDLSERILVILGAPYGSSRGKLYNAAFVLGEFPGPLVIPKRNLPNYSEFYEKRWFDVPLPDEPGDSSMGFSLVPSGVFSVNTKITDGNHLVIGVELCEDLWAVKTPSTDMVLEYGADLIVNISASPRIIGKSEYTKDLIRMTSARLCCAYVYCSAGPSESTTDLVFSGLSAIYENGVLLGESKEVIYEDQITSVTADIDLESIKGFRRKNKTITSVMKQILPEDQIDIQDPENFGYCGEPERNIDSHPFMPRDTESGFHEILMIQSLGLQKRFSATGCSNAVIGVSGGSDSTLALLALVKAFDALDISREYIHAISMPCFGTTGRTRGNAQKLSEALGVTFKEIPIGAQVEKHLDSLGHPMDVFDIAYENAQARARTMVLFDYSNMVGGLVVGTGDLSELALGWCTYGADHLSSYNPNVGVPKSLVIPMLQWISGKHEGSPLGDVLKDIAGTPISPELLPGGNQLSEDTVGPYEVMDFFLYHFVRGEWGVKRILWASGKAFKGKYSLEFLKERFLVFLKRFRSQQFKRSCLPDGPKVGSVSLSPRGDWRMPSDMNFDILINKIENYEV